MAGRKSHRHSHSEPVDTAASSRGESSFASEEEANGAAGTSQEVRVSPPASSQEPVMQRAEVLADRLAERIGHYASMFGFKLMQLAARKEEAEDIWAEAQSIRRGNQPTQSSEPGA